MRYLRCKCGEHEAWTTDAWPECDGCEKCKTTLAGSATGHGEIAPHDFGEPEWKVDAKTGERWQERRCRRLYCRAKERIKASEAAP